MPRTGCGKSSESSRRRPSTMSRHALHTHREAARLRGGGFPRGSPRPAPRPSDLLPSSSLAASRSGWRGSMSRPTMVLARGDAPVGIAVRRWLRFSRCSSRSESTPELPHLGISDQMRGGVACSHGGVLATTGEERTAFKIPIGGGRYLKHRPPLVPFYPLDLTRTARMGRRLGRPCAGTLVDWETGAGCRQRRHGGGRRRRSGAPLDCMLNTPAGSSDDNAGGVAAASFADSPCALWSGASVGPPGAS